MCGIATLLALAGLVGATGSCREPLTGPEGPALATVEVRNPCTRITFPLVDGDSVVGTLPPAPCASSPVVIEPGDAPVWNYQHNPNRRLRVPVRIRNQDAGAIGWPRVTLSPSGKTVLAPVGGLPSTMLPHDADSVRLDGTAVWRLAPASGGAVPETLESGTATASRMLVFRIDPPTTEGAFEFNILYEQDTLSFPAVAPDSTPAWFQDDSSWAATGMLRRVLMVNFEDGSSLAARKAAMDSIGGVVVGGLRPRPEWMGWYYIRVDSAVTEADLLILIEKLERQPGVHSAMLVVRGKTAWRRPIDGPGWSAVGDWMVTPGQYNTETWALTAIAAPGAWGCSVGSSATAVSVIEASFASDDYGMNLVTPQPGRAPGDTDPVPHGSVVANLVAARGDNQQGMTGVMWRAGLRLHPTPAIAGGEVLDAILSEGRAGSSVINLSIEAETNASPAIAAQWRRLVHMAMDTLIRENLPLPLLLVASGNDGRDPVLAGLPGAAEDFPRNVLVVGAVGRPSADSAPLMPGSGVGELVRIFAPGQAIGFRSNSLPGQAFTATGTSYAAPLVSGIAGLLKSFDPSLTSEEIHDLIVAGAAAGNIPVIGDPGKFVANAYESLKLAARRPGAPLCGNRIWSELSGGASVVKVERQGMDEVIYTAPATDTLALVFPAHGGREIYTEAFTPNGVVRRQLDWGPASWSATILPGYDESNFSGTTWSFYGFTHDADSVSYPRRAGYGGFGGPAAMNFTVTLGTQSSVGRTLGSFTGPSMPPPTWVIGKRYAITDSTGALVGYTDSQAPGDQIIASSFEAASVTTHPSPMNDRVFLVVNYFHYQSNPPTDWGPCPGATPVGSGYSCEERHALGTAGSIRTEVWGSSSWGSGTLSKLWERTGQTIGWLGLAEQSTLGMQEAVIGIGFSNALPFVGFPGTFTSCGVEYVNIVTGATTKAARPADPRMTCQYGAGELGTLAPIAPSLIAPGPLR